MQESRPTQQEKYEAQFSHAKTMAIQPEESSLGAANIAFPMTHYKLHPTETMHAVEWLGKTSVQVAVKPKPTITEPKDAILKITSTAICGSDLHHYHNEFPGWHKGDILGHEFMGIIQEVGPEVKNIKKGDRVVVGFPIACGSCEYCKKGYFSACDTTNPSKAMEMQYGHRCAGAFGYSHMTGGYEGGQAEFVRVPFADIGCLKVPESLSDEQVLFLSDIAPTGWHANVCANTGPGQTVGVWGCGPVGCMAMMWARMRGVSRIIAIDNVQYRLDFAKKHYGAETINFADEDVIKTVQKIAPGGFDASMDCAGFRFPKTLIEKVERAVMLETDQSTVLNEMIYLTKKYGSLGVVADYVGFTNHFNIGALMEKGLRMATGQTPVQSYWKELLGYIEEGRVDPTAIITHRMNLDDAAEGYKIFDQRLENCIKVVLKPGGKTGTA